MFTRQDKSGWSARIALSDPLDVAFATKLAADLMKTIRKSQASIRSTPPSRLQEPQAQARLLREIFGNPFRPVVFDPNWRTSTVVALTRGMYESRDFSIMPVLADALQDAGCEHEEIIAHCRGDGPHVRGCWVVDLVLGKN